MWSAGSEAPDYAAPSPPGSDDCLGQTYEKLQKQPVAEDNEEEKQHYQMLCMKNSNQSCAGH